MLALLIILVLLILFLILSVGVDAAYDGAVFVLKVKAGPVKFKILPGKEKSLEAEGEKTENKEKKKKKDKKQKREEEHKPKRKLGLDDILELAGIGLRTLGRFRRSLSVDQFMLHMAVASADPYDAVLLFGRVNAGLSALSPLLHRVLKIREEDIRTCVDTEPGALFLEARVVATLQIWQIFYIASSAGFAFLRWSMKRKKKTRKLEQKG